MGWVIKNKDESIGYYTGQDWNTNKDLAKRYGTQAEADQVIRQHQMKATTEQVQQ